MQTYWPIFRGKQFELLALRETAQLMSGASINPVIEPVKRKTSSFQRCIETLLRDEVPVSVVINPLVGEYSSDTFSFMDEFEKLAFSGEVKPQELPRLLSFVLSLSSDLTTEDIDSLVARLAQLDTVGDETRLHLFTRGFPDAGVVKQILEKHSFSTDQDLCILLEDPSSRRHFQAAFPLAHFVIVEDGFEKRKNADYERFRTELFNTAAWDYVERRCHGFGDYSIVGKDFSESGGPAWAVAIHLTFISEDPVKAMYIRHYVSDDNDSPSFPAEKYEQALDKLFNDTSHTGSEIPRTSAVEEFERLHSNGHYPGLGYVKKLSMVHHLELMAEVLGSDG